MIDSLDWTSSINFGWVLPFLFIITVVVFFHELGHFLVARWNGVAVETFSIGFGPELVGFTDRKGTRWRVSAIPLGGYVKFLGDDNVASAGSREAALAGLDAATREKSFIGKRVGQRAAIVAAGPIANFILAVVIFTALFTLGGRAVVAPVIDSVNPDTPAAAAGLLPGDRIVSVDGHAIESFDDISRYVGFAAGRELSFMVDRGGVEQTILITPREEIAEDRLGNSYKVGRIGVVREPDEGDVTIVRYSLFQSIGMSLDQVWFTVSSTVGYVGRVIVGRESLDQLGGPITVARVAQEAAEVGFTTLLSFAAFISISIGFVNLIPIPLLDGGHLLFYGIEAIRRRPLSARAQDIGLRIGLALVLLLMVVAIRNDIVSLARYLSNIV